MTRSRNEDAFLVDDTLGLYVVSDGLGGHAGGDVAAREAVNAVFRHVFEQRELLARIRQRLVSEELLSTLATGALRAASREVFRQSTLRPELSGMGCTLTVLLIGIRQAAMAHVGDSRLYLRREGRVCQLSADHTLARELARHGIITSSDIGRVPSGHVLTQAVGTRATVEPEELLIHLAPGDRFVLCTDGLWRYLDKPEDLDDFCESHPTSAESLVAFANSAGGHDNISAVVVRLEETVDDADREATECGSSGVSDTIRLISACRSDELPTI